ncbi:MAG TPA: hypothetical protein VMH23_07440, partial [Bacteroidota bacterium]|nr:hypothetical protein [Bacteroidota bacterium]
DAAAYYCLLQSEERLPDGTVYSVAAYPRLFRNMPKFRFTGRVHEQIEPSIVRSGLRLKHSNVVIEHLGYAQSAEINRAKCERNMALLRDQVLENPGDQYSRYQLGNTLAILGFNQEAMEELGKVLRDGSVGTTLRVSVLNCLAHVAENLGGVEEGLTFSRESLDLDKGQISARWQIAGFCMIRREYADALELLKEIESLQHSRHRGEKFNRPLDAVIPEVALVQRIATCLGAEGKFSEASDWLFRVLEKHVDDERVLSRYFLCLAQLDDLAGHADQLEQLMSRGVRSSSLYCALARLYLCRGESQRAKATLERCPRTEQANAELSALWLEYALANADMMRARKAYETALRLGVDTYRFHKTAVKYLLASRDLSRAVLHLQKMGQGMEQMQPSHSASSPL